MNSFMQKALIRSSENSPPPIQLVSDLLLMRIDIDGFLEFDVLRGAAGAAKPQ